MKNIKKNPATVVTGFSLWRKRWDSNPRAREDYLISSQARYDHFDTLPCIQLSEKCKKNKQEQKRSEKFEPP